jgi:radical SAM protein with 4Fe4S-binding SPASM domain
MALLDTLPHKIQLSLHSHESNARGELSEYMDQVMCFSTRAAGKGTCMVLRLWNQGGMDRENEEVMRLIERYVPKPWKERPDGFRLCDNLYLEFDRKFEWPGGGGRAASDDSDGKQEESDGKLEASPSKSKQEYFCKALIKQIGVLSDGSLVPCCLDHDGDVILGNLFHQSLEEILASPRAQALVEGFRHHAATEPLCQSCESSLVNKSFRGKKRK